MSIPIDGRRTNNLKWSSDEDAALREYRLNGLSGSQISAELWREFRKGYSRNAVIGRLHRLGLCNAKAPSKPTITKKRQAPPKPPAPPAPKPDLAALRCVEVVPRLIPLLELTDSTCRYPYGECPPYRYCGCPVGQGSYCMPHMALCVKVSQ